MIGVPQAEGGLHQELTQRLQQFGSTALEFLQGRIALLQWELAQERARLGTMISRALLAGFFLLLSVQLLAMLLVALTWDTPWRVPVIAGLLGGAFVVTAALAWGYRAKRQQDLPLFSNTLHELAKDRQSLENLR
jgi:uncharacterized membrane protein YqjE